MSSTNGGTGLIPWRMGGGVTSTHLLHDRSVAWFSVVNQTRGSECTCSPASAFRLFHCVGRGVRRHLRKWPGKCPWLQVAGMVKVQFILVKARDQRKMQRSRHPWYPGVHVWKSCLFRQSKDRHTRMSHLESRLSSLMITDFLGSEFCGFQISHELFALRVSFLFLPLFVLV